VSTAVTLFVCCRIMRKCWSCWTNCSAKSSLSRRQHSPPGIDSSS